MSVVVVAGGLGDLGRLIVDALIGSGKHEVYITTRKALKEEPEARISPLTGRPYMPIICTDYSEDSILEVLTERNVDVKRLISAADRCACVKRFIPSEFNVEYDVGDDVLPYMEKRFHMEARKHLAGTRDLEYTFIYPGMFMDYFGLPRVQSCLRQLCFFIDPENGVAVLPDDGEAKMSMTVTIDAARYIVLALELEKWPRIMTTVASTVTLNNLVKLVEQSMGKKLQVSYQPVEKLLKHEVIDLPTNLEIPNWQQDRFPEGMSQLRGLIADLEAGVALGAYDLDALSGHLDLVKEFEGKAPPPKRIEELIEEAWGSTAI
ncbi:hypothetical protein B0I35DRAFT_363994 [Stachybotrys elegans]|uniref:NmrA-like domain-containing protein n=1 Tax=Stachybotrys elegans TaxID=80388 RepID=A0A8K0SE34_9HYPO|nr:hypothetical protein B0I35DRAFT_363994 [Stachybotrys elegans]